jgi:16S rRNA (guanine1207-N2)-methyltransferase
MLVHGQAGVTDSKRRAPGRLARPGRIAPVSVADPALEALFLPFMEDTIAWPASQGGLFLGARAGRVLHARPWPGLACAQAWKPEVDALHRAGFDAAAEPASGTRHPLVLLLPPRQREHARACFARALARLAPGGTLVACMPNQEGARTGEADLSRLAGPLRSQSKHHCRVFWTGPLDAPADPALAAEWEALDAPRRIADAGVPGGGFLSRPGVFAWDRVDAASRLLADHLPGDLRGAVADLGAGWGYLAGQVLARCSGVASLDLYEADARALELARANLAMAADALPVRNVATAFHWHDVAAGLGQARYDAIVCNPPFHAQGAGERVDLGRAFIAAAANALRPGGRLLLVANRHLPYEAALAGRFDAPRELATRDGFKVIEARATAAARA